MKIKKGDEVVVIAGKDRGKTGKVIASFPEENKLIVEGINQDENGIVAVFEKRPNDYLQTTPRGAEFEKLVQRKKLEVLYLRPQVIESVCLDTLLRPKQPVMRCASLAGLQMNLRMNDQIGGILSRQN